MLNLSSISNIYNKLKEKTATGYNWLGNDGILNMETSALLTIFLMLFFSVLWSMTFSFLIVSGKCAFDKARGSDHEKHDLICSCIGVIFGAILGTVHAAIIIA